jgi:hypothetical protein
MKKMLISTIAAGALMLAACGGSDSKSSSTAANDTSNTSAAATGTADPAAALGAAAAAGTPTDAQIDAVLNQMKKTGLKFDDACVRAVIKKTDYSKLAADPGGALPKELINQMVSCFTK